jgi:hypothetical protein
LRGAAGRVLDGQPDLLGGGAFALDEQGCEEVDRLCLRRDDAEGDEFLLFPPAHGEDPVGGGFYCRFLPGEVVLVAVPFRLLACDDLRLEDGLFRKVGAHPATGLFVFVYPFGDDIPGSGEGLFRGGDPFLRIDERGGLGKRIEHLLLGEDALGEGLQPLLPGHGCPCATLGTEGEVDIFEDGKGCRDVDFASQFIGEELALDERLEDRLAPLVEFSKLCETVADRHYRDLVEGPGGLLPVTGDKGDRRPFPDEEGCRRDLRLSDIEFGGDLPVMAFRRIFRGCVVPVWFRHCSWAFPGSGVVRPLISQARVFYKMKLRAERANDGESNFFVQISEKRVKPRGAAPFL